jgi:hypothetical protein
MKRLSLFGFVGVLAGVLVGCPIYDDDDYGTSSDDDCRGSKCDPGPEPGCEAPSDCGINETCGSDGECHVGDCTLWGCSSGFECTLNDDQTTTCQEPGSTSSSGEGGAGAGGGAGVGGAGGAGGSPLDPVYCGNPDDCGAGETCAPSGICTAGDCSKIGCIYGYACSGGLVCKPANPAACSDDAQCSGFGAGYLCVSGICTAPSDQCSDQTQCPASNKCADGKCTTACAANADCPTGYDCNMTLGVCSKPTVPCSVTNDCGGPDSVCVDGACVPRSNAGMCPKDHVWVANGCIPTQSATFFCNADGQQDSCAAGSVCLHHNCYLSCEAPNPTTSCDNLPSFNVCKEVTTSSGAHKVCGSNQNLGSECDPTLGSVCSGNKACIDGFCK